MKFLVLIFSVILFSSSVVGLIKHQPYITLKHRNSCPAKTTLVFLGEKEITTEQNSILSTYKLVKDTFFDFGPKALVKDVFTSPRANLFIAVDGLDDSVASNIAIEKLKIMGKVTDTKCTSTASLPKFVSLMTGVCPRKHKIVGEFLVNSNGLAQKAYTRQGTYHEVDGLSDLLFKQFKNGKVIAISSEEKYVRAASPFDISRTKSFFWKDNQFSSEMNREKILSKLEKIKKVNPLAIVNKDEVTLVFGSEETKFSLTETEDFMFFAEVIGFSSILKKQVEEHLSNCCPTFYNLIFASLKGIAMRYGVKSSKYTAAARFLDVFIPKIISKMSKVYEGRIISQVTILGGLENTPKIEQVEKVLENKLLAPLEKHFPVIYTKEENTEICEQVKSLLNQHYQVSCGGVNTDKGLGRKPKLFTIQPDLRLDWINSNDTTLQTAAIADWQTWLWTSVLMWIAIFAAVYMVSTIEYDDITSWIILDLQEKAHTD